MDPAQAPIKATTQEHLDIEDVQEGIVVKKNGSCCLVLKTTAVNFNLLSEKEQDAIIYAYAGLLNSLSFAIQIVINSQKKDISSYLKILKKQKEKIESNRLKNLIEKYRQFVEKIVKENEVLDKNFYIIIPFSLLELGVSQTVKTSISKKESQLPFPKDYILEKAKAHLFPKRDHIIKQFSRLGLQANQLNTRQLIKLFYHLYNPKSLGQKLSPDKNYSSFLVGADVDEEGKNKTPSSQPAQAQPQPAGQTGSQTQAATVNQPAGQAGPQPQAQPQPTPTTPANQPKQVLTNSQQPPTPNSKNQQINKNNQSTNPQ